MARQRARERGAAHHFGADRGDQVAHIGAFGLFQQGREGLFERQAGFQQAGQLAREQRQLVLRQALAEAARTRRAAFVDLGRDRFDRERRQALQAQVGAGAARAVGIQHALAGDAAGVDGFVAECWHGLV
jgi:hypothetical protein